MNVCVMKVTDDNGSLSSSMTTQAMNTFVKERLWANCVASEIVCQSLHPDTGAPSHEKRVTAVREESNLHLEFYLWNAVSLETSCWWSRKVLRR